MTVQVGGHPAGAALRRLTAECIARATWATRSVAAWRQREPSGPTVGQAAGPTD